MTYPYADTGPTTMDIQGRLDELNASIERHDSDGDLLEQLVEDAATSIPSWELRRCWSYAAWPARADHDLPPHEDGIDLVAEKTDGDLVAIQCKARSSGNVTPTHIQKFAGKANPKIFNERWLIATTELTTGNERALVECDVIWKNALVELRHVTDMNDHKIFGPTGYRRSYVHAVENDLLTDYRIIAFAVDEKMWIAAERICMNVDEKRASQKKKQVQLTVTEAVGWLVYGIVLYGGAPEATDGKPIRTSIAFLNRIARSREMAS